MCFYTSFLGRKGTRLCDRVMLKGVRAIFSVENNTIVISKGDSADFNIALTNPDGSDYVPQKGDRVIFSVKLRSGKKHLPVILKEGPEIMLESEETEKIDSGEYLYDVFVETTSGERQTVIEGKFKVRKVVHDFE